MPVDRDIRLLVKARAPSATGFALSDAHLSMLGAMRAAVVPLMPAINAGLASELGIAGGAGVAAQWYEVQLGDTTLSPWDAAHRLRAQDLGLAAQVDFVEPDIRQNWLWQRDEVPPALALSQNDPVSVPQDSRFPRETDDDWYRDAAHSGFLDALARLDGVPTARRRRVRVAQLDTGYDPGHQALPVGIDRTLARNFVAGEDLHDASDQVDGPLTNRGHGTGTLGILAGRDPADPTRTIGGAPFVEIVPIRVADRVVLFSNSAIARALDYVFSLKDDPEKRIDIVTMSMGGLPSQAWADAVNALYDAGIFVVTAAGNNYGNAPTRNIVFPARFNRVVAACGVMADGSPYADLPGTLMAGNYGPASKMRTAIAAATPNLPWARIGAPTVVDHDGSGTSSATPQVAAAAAIWLADSAHSAELPEDWRRVEAIRYALFASARGGANPKLGRGTLDAVGMAAQSVPLAELEQEKPDTASFAFLRALLGVGLTDPSDDPTYAMLSLEALQLSLHPVIEAILPDLDADPDQLAAATRQRLAATLATDARASMTLRHRLAKVAGASNTGAPPPTDGGAAPQALESPPSPSAQALNASAKLANARQPVISAPLRRHVRIFASDPTLGTGLDTVARSVTTVSVAWERLAPGPVGEYLEVVDVDPASSAAYAPVALDDPYLLHEHGLFPSETDPQFHQQMVYAVAMRTIEAFEHALGRRALWSPYRDPNGTDISGRYVQRLRIYPHALRAANAFYSPAKKALLLGYFQSPAICDHADIARPTVFAALSHDIVAHETAHALLDGLHRRFIEPTNPDVLAFHEGFADIVAMFLHFTLPDAVRPEIAATRGDLFTRNRLGQLAYQFGQATGQRGALRDYIGTIDAKGHWKSRPVSIDDYHAATEAHDRGAVLVAAVFDAFLRIYECKAKELIALATGASGVLPPGELSAPLVDALTIAVCKIAGRFLDIMIRALDYCPPFDITFGEYLRAVITADRDLVPDDRRAYRVAITAAFRARGISPRDVRSVSPDTLAWETPDLHVSFKEVVDAMALDFPLDTTREEISRRSAHNARVFHDWLVQRAPDDWLTLFGIARVAGPMNKQATAADGTVTTIVGNVRGPEVHSVRTLRRVGPDGTIRSDLIVELTQSWYPADPKDGQRFRGGCTLIIARDSGALNYVVRKRIDSSARYSSQATYVQRPLTGLRAAYFNADSTVKSEPFAMLHTQDFE